MRIHTTDKPAVLGIVLGVPVISHGSHSPVPSLQCTWNCLTSDESEGYSITTTKNKLDTRSCSSTTLREWIERNPLA